MKEHQILAAMLMIAVSACAGHSQKSDPVSVENESASASSLSHRTATARAKQIAHVTYNLFFGLDGEHEEYDGRSVVTFELKPKAKDFGNDIFIDFEDGTVTSLSLNGAPVIIEKNRYDGHKIIFKLSELQSTTNRVEIAFRHPYSKNSEGLYRFKDPEDGKIYLYSDFEPYGAHRMFPCFDQPDLKASFELTVEAPEDWEVVSNTPERDVSKIDGRKSWAFPPSPLLSTYLFAIHAGPYAKWASDANGIPLRLFARKSIAKHVDFKEWFEITQQGLEFYATFFGYPYPYSKYDQLLVPDFNPGAMENAGAVTFTEKYVYRTPVTQDVHHYRAGTILHEMAHMWFGDLVTMRWWNGLWLNESFATYMSALAVDQATRFKGSWQSFEADKQRGYWEDQLVTTHPIDVPIPDTDHAFSNFDGITYQKGASVLKQLHYYLGDDAFREGVQRYFQRFALRNTSLKDFMKMMSEASDQDLTNWQQSWLQTAGLNTVRADWSCEDGAVKTFTLLQGSTEMNQTIRPHRAEVAFFHVKNGKLEPGEIFPTTYSQERNDVPAAIGKPCPQFVFPNYQDNDWTKVELDPKSLEYVKANLGTVPDPFLRQMIWHVLWDMARDAKLRIQDYAEIVLKHASRETDTKILSAIADSMTGPRGTLAYLSGEDRKHYLDLYEDFSRKKFAYAKPGSDLQLQWFKVFKSVASSDQSVQLAKSMLEGKRKIEGFPMDEERRWQSIFILSRAGAPEAKDLIDAELKRDPSDLGQKNAAAASVAIPSMESKQAWLAKILRSPGAETVSDGTLRSAMENFYQLNQEELTATAIQPYFDQMTKIGPIFRANEVYAARLGKAMFPALCNPEVVTKAGAAINLPDLPAPITKSLKVWKQETERCLKVRAFSSEHQKTLL